MLNCGNGSLGVLPQRELPRTSPEPPVVAAEGYRARGPTRELSRTRQGHVNPPRRQGAVRVPAEYSTRCDVTYWTMNTTPNGRNFFPPNTVRNILPPAAAAMCDERDYPYGRDMLTRPDARVLSGPSRIFYQMDVTYWMTNTTPNGRNVFRRTLYGISYRCATNASTLMWRMKT